MTPLTGIHGAGRSVGITLDRELFIERGDVIAHAGATPRDTRRIRARIFWLHDKPLSKGDQILIRLGTRESRASVVAIEKAVDPGELSNEETKAIARNHVGEIDISLAQPIAADPYQENPRTGRLVIEINGRIAGGGLVLSVDAGQRAVPIDIVPVESALRPEERSARYHHNGAVIWLTGLPGSGKSTLARALERRLFSRGGSPILLDGDTLRAGLNSDLGFSPQDRSENIRRLAEVATHLARNGHIAIVAAVSPSIADRAVGAPHRRYIVPRNPRRCACGSLREPRSEGSLRQGPRRHTAVVYRHHQRLPAADRMRIADRHLEPLGFGCDRRDRANAVGNRHPVRRIGGSGGQYLSLLGTSHRPGFRAKRADNAALFGAFFAAFFGKQPFNAHFYRESPS